jgi:XTP/dITP diphosphohydrolase
MVDLVVATRNRKKLAEIKALLSGLNFKVLSIADFPEVPEIREDGETFEENAEKKAVQVAKITKRLTLADDSGLEIDYLGGDPGVRSARFAGENATDEDRNRKVLGLLKDVPQQDRTARFKCAVAVVLPDMEVKTVRGVCEGEITLEPRGSAGFGYDPVFMVPEYGKTFSELGPEKKNQISHRAMALKKAKKLLVEYLADMEGDSDMDLMDVIKSRRSIRAYKDKPIEDDKLNAVLEAGRLAPSARNLQEWRYVVVKDKSLREKMVDAANGQRFVGQASAIIVACAVQTDHVMPCEELSYPIDVAISVDHMTLMAAALGLGTCWIGAFKQDKVKKLLNVPDEVKVVALLPIGYPDVSPDPRPRKSMEEIVTYDKW